MAEIVIPSSIVIPAKAGISGNLAIRRPYEMPAFAGMTERGA